MRILYITTIGGTMNFFKSLINELVKEGNIVDIATNASVSPVSDFFADIGCKIFQIPTSRSPFSFGNIKAIRIIRNIAKNYDIVHCHTPLAGLATRIACKKLRKENKLKVIYTAHGFHFYKGAPVKNWLIYYPIEKICSRWTDVLITINKEDYAFAKNKMRAKQIEYVPGVGVDTTKFANIAIDKTKKREELGVPSSSFVILSIGELNKNKNHQIIIKAISELNNQNIIYLIAGVGSMKDKLLALSAKYKVNVLLLGYRKDVPELYKCSDLFVLPSIREGLNVSLIEAVSSGVNCIASTARGNADICGTEEWLCRPLDSHGFAAAILNVVNGKSTQHKDQIDCDFKMFDYKNINNKMKEFYK